MTSESEEASPAPAAAVCDDGALTREGTLVVKGDDAGGAGFELDIDELDIDELVVKGDDAGGAGFELDIDEADLALLDDLEADGASPSPTAEGRRQKKDRQKSEKAEAARAEAAEKKAAAAERKQAAKEQRTQQKASELRRREERAAARDARQHAKASAAAEQACQTSLRTSGLTLGDVFKNTQPQPSLTQRAATKGTLPLGRSGTGLSMTQGGAPTSVNEQIDLLSQASPLQGVPLPTQGSFAEATQLTRSNSAAEAPHPSQYNLVATATKSHRLASLWSSGTQAAADAAGEAAEDDDFGDDDIELELIDDEDETAAQDGLPNAAREEEDRRRATERLEERQALTRFRQQTKNAAVKFDIEVSEDSQSLLNTLDSYSNLSLGQGQRSAYRSRKVLMRSSSFAGGDSSLSALKKQSIHDTSTQVLYCEDSNNSMGPSEPKPVSNAAKRDLSGASQLKCLLSSPRKRRKVR